MALPQNIGHAQSATTSKPPSASPDGGRCPRLDDRHKDSWTSALCDVRRQPSRRPRPIPRPLAPGDGVDRTAVGAGRTQREFASAWNMTIKQPRVISRGNPFLTPTRCRADRKKARGGVAALPPSQNRAVGSRSHEADPIRVTGLSPAPAQAERFKWDDDVKGFGIRIRPIKRTWIIPYRIGTKQRRPILADILQA
jgi:hypothetical protein